MKGRSRVTARYWAGDAILVRRIRRNVARIASGKPRSLAEPGTFTKYKKNAASPVRTTIATRGLPGRRQRTSARDKTTGFERPALGAIEPTPVLNPVRS